MSWINNNSIIFLIFGAPTSPPTTRAAGSQPAPAAPAEATEQHEMDDADGESFIASDAGPPRAARAISVPRSERSTVPSAVQQGRPIGIGSYFTGPREGFSQGF